MPSSSDEVKGAQTLTKADSFATLKLNRATPRYTAAAVAVSDQAELSTCYAVGWCDGRTAKAPSPFSRGACVSYKDRSRMR